MNTAYLLRGFPGSHVPCVWCPIPAMKVVSTVHCTETGGHGVFPFSVCPAGENKYSLTRVKYTRPSISVKCVWFTAVNVSCGRETRDTEDLDSLYFIQALAPGWQIDSVGGCGEQGLAPAPLTSLFLKMKVVAKPVLGIAPHRVGTSLNKSLLILITFPQARCCSDLDFPGYCRVMLSHVHRDRAMGEILLVLLDFPCPVQYSFFASVSLECVRVTTRYRISIQDLISLLRGNDLTPVISSSMMRLLSCLLLGAALVAADKPAVAPKYEPEAQASQTAPVYAAPQAAPAPTYNAPQAAPAPTYNAPQAAAPDTYGAPSAEPVADNDDYGAPQAQPLGQDSYGAPQAQPIGNKRSFFSKNGSYNIMLQVVTVTAPPRPPRLVTRGIITTTTP